MSVTRVYCDKTTEVTITRFPLQNSTPPPFNDKIRVVPLTGGSNYVGPYLSIGFGPLSAIANGAS